MYTTWRKLLRLLCLVVVTAFSGSLIGPVIGGGFGYTWGYLGGIFGPLALVLIAALCVVEMCRPTPAARRLP